MIYFFVTRQHAYTMSWFLSDWASDHLKKNLRIVPYDLVPSLINVTPGAFIFSDLERLNTIQLTFVEDLCDQLVSFDTNIPILNHPRFVLSRYNLLSKLHDSGFNKFNVYRASDKNCELHYPVFLRTDNDHFGPRSKLMNNRRQVDRVILQTMMQGIDISNMMLVEYCETKDSFGYYRKYAAFRIGEKIIPGHLIFNTDWVVKDGKPSFEKSHEQEKESYMKENPHREKIYKIFELAGITYGRIDYSMLNGSVQTWEINTNPILIKQRKIVMEKPKELLPIKEQLAKRLESMLMLYNYGGDVTEYGKKNDRIPLNWDTQKYV